MSIAAVGDTLRERFFAVDISGNGQQFSNLTAFQAAGWDLSLEVNGTATAFVDTPTIEYIPEGSTWAATTPYALHDFVMPTVANGYYYEATVAGTSAGSQPTWPTTAGATVVDGPVTWKCRRTAGMHEFTATAVSGFMSIRILYPYGYISDPAVFTDKIESYDNDGIAGLMLTSYGTPGIANVDAGTLGTLINGDAFADVVRTIPLATVSPFGWSNLTGFTITAQAKRTGYPDDTPVSITATWIDAATREYQLSWNTYPTGIFTLDATEISRDLTIDVQVKEPSGLTRIKTVARHTVTIQWQANNLT